MVGGDAPFDAGATGAGRTVLLVGLDTPIRRALALLLDAVGAVVVTCAPAELPVSDALQFIGVVALGDDLSAALPADQLTSRLAELRRWPLLAVGLGAGGELLDSLAEVTAVCVRSSPPARASSYSFASDEPMLWPFEGLRLPEARSRVVRSLVAGERALEPLISAGRGHVMARLVAPGAAVYLATVSGWEDGPPPILVRSFCAESFMDTLPVLAFVRAALRGRGWRRPQPQATCIVDDPNLRSLRYGHLDFRAAVGLARERPFHLSVGFVPLDHGTTAAPVARYFRAHPKELSLLIHGNDHLRAEMARDVDGARADRSVRQALARMRHHEVVTGLSCPPVITPPHGACTRPWVRALASAGYTAVVATATHPYTDRPEGEGAGELHEFFCAEMGLYGFPVILRYPVVGHRNRWLFAAWLGKPLIIYAHHGDFAGGAEELLTGVDFINERFAPQWASIADIVSNNYQLRTAGCTAAARVFSNDVAIKVPAGIERMIVSKSGCDLPYSEEARVDGRPTEAAERSGRTLCVELATAGRSLVRVQFGPAAIARVDDWRHVSARSRARRLATETRDRLAPIVAAGGSVNRSARGGND